MEGVVRLKTDWRITMMMVTQSLWMQPVWGSIATPLSTVSHVQVTVIYKYSLQVFCHGILIKRLFIDFILDTCACMFFVGFFWPHYLPHFAWGLFNFPLLSDTTCICCGFSKIEKKNPKHPQPNSWNGLSARHAGEAHLIIALLNFNGRGHLSLHRSPPAACCLPPAACFTCKILRHHFHSSQWADWLT